MRNIKFISYDGNYPNLCSGTLIFSVDNIQYKCKYCMISGGHISWGDDWSDFYISTGAWELDFNEIDKIVKLTDEEKNALTDEVNENAESGCCGGCS